VWRPRDLFGKAWSKENTKRFDGLLRFNRDGVRLRVIEQQVGAVINGKIAAIYLVERLAAVKAFQRKRAHALPEIVLALRM
jgi:hypothetical protein